jgi:hypothetical protein
MLSKDAATRGLRLIVVGSGSAAVAKGVGEELDLQRKAGLKDVTFAVDPSLAVYKAFGLYRGVARTFVWHRWENVKGLCAFPSECCCKCRCTGCPGSRNGGDPWQQGGSFVLLDNAAIFEHREVNPGWPVIEEETFMKAARQAGAASVASASGADKSSAV